MKPKNEQQPTSVSQPAEIIAGRCGRLKCAVAQIAIRVLNKLEGFFYDPDAFRFKGIMTFGLQLLGVLGLGISLQLLAHPAAVIVENREPIACFDTALFEESYALRKLAYPQKLREAIQKLTLRDWPNSEYLITVGAVSRGLPSPADISHHILCWYIKPRSAERLKEVRRLRDAVLRGLERPPTSGEPSLSTWATRRAERMARAEDEPIDTLPLRELSASSFLTRLTEFSTPTMPLELAVVLKPPDSESRYRNPEAWKEDIRIAEISGDADILNAIEVSGLQGYDLAQAFEQFDHVRCFFNWIAVSTTSTHALASKVSITIARRPGRSDVLGGTLQLNQQQRHFTGTIEKLLPKEQPWALLRTSRPVQTSDIDVATDPTPFFDRDRVWKVTPFMGVIFLAWIVGNVHARQSGRRGLL